MITGSNNISLREVKVKPFESDKVYIKKDLIEDKFYHIADQFNEKKIAPAKFYSILLSVIHPFHDGNGRTCKKLFVNNNEMIKLTKNKKIKMN